MTTLNFKKNLDQTQHKIRPHQTLNTNYIEINTTT